MKLKLGFSTCPNDTFMFNAMVHQKINTNGFDFTLHLSDIEELNNLAFRGELDITKISYAAYTKVSDKYIFLNSGSALGNNNGPLLISKKKIYPDEIEYLRIAIPGKLTTANLLLSIACPDATNKTEFLFSDIEEAVLSGEVDAGLIIHENRFTYEKKGLKKIIDLGEFWEESTNKPIPLGGIAIKRSLDIEIQLTIDQILHNSIAFAFNEPDSGLNFIKQYAQEMSEDVMKKHIELYVNNFSLNIGNEGKDAVEILYKKAIELKLVNNIQYPIFVENKIK
ncbi:MAG: 1,4-dihydroxy-6-naphthoate synthase [Chlorobi bacterium]|nr:1,4-dihydroxy-6-naphthoate synthase [Chlorobiota bacterium]